MNEAPASVSPQEKPVSIIDASYGPVCPECGSKRLYKDGMRNLANGEAVQRYLCRDCGYRFSWPKTERRFEGKNLKSDGNLTKSECSSRVLALLEQSVEGAMSNAEEESEKRAAGATALSQTEPLDVKGKILEYAWWMKKQGYSEQTIQSRIKKLNRLVKLGANLLEPESVKEVIAKLPWKVSTKANVCAIYGCFAKLNDLDWKPPIYRPNYEMPFIPTEAEIDMLIAASGKKLSALLQLIKETGIRIGEACKLKWTDLNPQQRIIKVQAEKGSKPRIFRLSEECVDMLNRLPKKSDRIFPNDPRSLQNLFKGTRLRLTHKLGNLRLKEIRFHTIRHWKATMLYHQTKDILHVKEFLGHRSLDSTLTYINIENAIFGTGGSDEFHVKTAKTVEEACKLAELGFEYFDTIDGIHIYRKRK